MNPLDWLRLGLGGATALFLAVTAPAVVNHTGPRLPSLLQTGVGFFTNFFDTLGIGSFAPTTTIFRLTRIVDDRIIPGTLNVGHTPPTFVQALIYTSIIAVDIRTLFSMIAASMVGAWLGAGIVARWPKRKVQTGMGIALLIAASLMFMAQFDLFPGGGTETGVRGARFVIAVSVNFVLGAFMTLGIGLYAPCMILVSLLGMNPTAAYPIMMGSCAFLMPVGGLKFVREKSYDLRTSLGLTLGGIPGVLLAAYIVVSMPLYAVRWVVIVVVLYASISMLWPPKDSAGRP
jgi:uncharacterized membrane protein YfcA